MHHFPIITIGGIGLDLATFIAITVTFIIVFVLARLAVRNLSVDKPSKLQNFMEWVVEFVHNTVASTMPLHRAKLFVSLGMTLIMFIFVSNLLGLPFGIVTNHTQAFSLFGFEILSASDIQNAGGSEHLAWWKSPTADIAVTAGLAITVFFIIHIAGLKMNTRGYLKHYFQPYWFFFPLNILETLVKPLTLAVRLYANIFAGELLIAVILMLGVFGIPLLGIWQGFSIFVGAIQAFLFTILTMVYIGQATVSHDDH
jgi:F-type H+-transporting ATPase subunit a